VVAAGVVGINQLRLLPICGTKELQCMTNSFDKNKYIDQLHKDMDNYFKKGGEVTKLPMSPEVVKIRKDINKKYFNKF